MGRTESRLIRRDFPKAPQAEKLSWSVATFQSCIRYLFIAVAQKRDFQFWYKSDDVLGVFLLVKHDMQEANGSWLNNIRREHVPSKDQLLQLNECKIQVTDLLLLGDFRSFDGSKGILVPLVKDKVRWQKFWAHGERIVASIFH
jgi:hypothetical protein